MSEDFIKEFQDNVDWSCISSCQILSEDFIKEFQDNVDWSNISRNQSLSEDFIEEFKNKVNWDAISRNQSLSEDFIRKFQNKINYNYISRFQMLSEDFIREFQNKVNWYFISRYQFMGSDFIKEFQDKINWDRISQYQFLSKNTMLEFRDNIGIHLQRSVTKKKSLKCKRLEVEKYAKKYDLKHDKEYLYAFRNHNKRGNDLFNKSIRYKKGIYYRDWHCDMRKYEINSFGLGIYPKGNTPVKVKISDWGLEVDSFDGKCRVFNY